MRRAVIVAVGMAACSYPRTDAPAGDDAAMIDAAIDAPIDTAPVDTATIDVPTIDAATIDAAMIDAGIAPQVTGCQVPLRIEAGTTASIACAVTGAPVAHVLWTLVAGAGSFAATSGAIDLDAGGSGSIALSFTAPGADGDAVHTVSVAGGNSVMFTTRTRVLTAVGDSASFSDSAGLSSSANYLYGQRLVLAQASVIMKLGLWSDAGGALGRLAIYSEVGGLPAVLQVATATAAIGSGRTELPVASPVQLAAGTYWIMGNFDTATPVRRGPTATVAQAYVVATLTAPLPTPLVSPTATTNRALNYYAMVAP